MAQRSSRSSRRATSPPTPHPAGRTEARRAIRSQLFQSARLASIGILTQNIAHEISNPLFAAVGMSEVLLENAELGTGASSTKEKLQVMHESAQRAANLVKDLLMLAELGNTPEPVRLSTLIDAALATVEQGFDEGIKMSKEYAEAPGILGFPDRLHQLFVNLLLNTMVTANSGGAIFIRSWAEGGFVKVSIKSTGATLPPGSRDETIERYLSKREANRSTEFALFVAQRIVRLHEGRMKIESQDDAGGEVSIEFPFNNLSSMRTGPFALGR